MVQETGMETLGVPLGTRGWMPHHGRETMCTLVKVGKCNLLLDCGTGISRLLSPAIRELMGDAPVTVILSHYHLDHSVGLMYLSGLYSRADYSIRLVGPRAGFTEFGLHEALDRLTSSPLSSRHYLQFPFQIDLMEFGPEGIEIDGIPIAVYLQAHPGGSVSIRIGDSVCYATDLAASEKAFPIAAGVDCLIHETWSIQPQSPNETHYSLAEALERAKQAGVRSLIPTHFGPVMPEEDIQSLYKFSTDSLDVIVPIEGQPIRIGHAPARKVFS